MKAIINTEDELIKSYLKVREKLIENFKNSNLSRESFKNSWLQEVEKNGNIELKEIKGNIDDNTKKIIKDCEKGIITFIKANSIFSENIIVGYK